jgi:beta-galactosidase
VKKDGSPLVATRETAGPAAAIVLTADRARLDADGEDVACVAARIVDAQGREVPTADHEIAFAVTGPGRLIGLGNGDPSSHEPDRVTHGSSDAWKRHAFNGLCMALVQTRKDPGAIRLEASAEGLTSGHADLRAEAASVRPALS